MVLNNFIEMQDGLDLEDSLLDSEQIIETIEDIDEEPSKNKKKPLVFYFDIFGDSEFKSTFPISFQAIFRGKILQPFQISDEILFREVEVLKKIIVLESSFKTALDINFIKKWSEENNVLVFFKDLSKDKTDHFIISILLDIFYKDYGFSQIKSDEIIININYWFYFSPKDLSIPFGPENMRKIYLSKNNNISQARCILGNFKIINNEFAHTFKLNITLKDLSGLDKSGLSNMAKSYGLLLEKSNKLDDYKSCMDKALLEKTIEFLEYGILDVEILYNISINIVESFNTMLIDVFKIKDPKYLYTSSNIPITIGSLVYNMFLKYLEAIFFKEDSALKLAIYSKSILNPLSKTYQTNKSIFKALKNFNSIQELKNYSIKNSSDYNYFLKIFSTNSNFKYLPWQYSSTKYLSNNSSIVDLQALSLVSGGRVINERPKECFIDKAVDIDIVSAYGSVLEKIIYPIGRPRIIAYTPNQSKHITLKDFFTKYESKLTNGLYKICVSGTLDFEQDLLFSRYIKENTFEKKFQKFDPDDPSTFRHSDNLVLLRNELKQATITAPLWHIIKKVATSQELKGFYQLEISSAIFYLDSDRINCLEDLGDNFLQDKKEIIFSSESTGLEDLRTFSWYGLQLAPIIKPILEKRKKLKENKENYALQNALKLFVNTMYGVICSVFFTINNVIVGDFITSSIRANSWLMAKSFNLHITVCDGGPFSLENVTFLKDTHRKPGFNELSYYYRYKNNRYLKFGSLGNLDWNLIIDNFPNNSYDEAYFGNLANNHLTTFWSHYNISIDFKVELKSLIQKGSYILKSHYLFKIWDFKNKDWSNDYYYKIRGFKYQKENKFLNPTYKLLIYLVENGLTDLNSKAYIDPWVIPNNGIYKTSKILKLNSWKLTLEDKTHSFYGEDYLPGDLVWEDREFKLNNTHFPFYKLTEYIKRNNRSLKVYKNKDGTSTKMPLFERFLEKNGIKVMLLKMEQDNLRSS